MFDFHAFLDRLFYRATSFSIFFRLWGAMVLVVLVLGAMSFYGINKTIRPSAKRVVEDTLVDASKLVALLIADDVDKLIKTGKSDIITKELAKLDTALLKSSVPNEKVWYDNKTSSQFHLYITDKDGVVIYDSMDKSVGQDFSRWNDVYLTLHGMYGARSTDVYGSSVMYVASPIIKDEKLIGVVSIGKPTRSLLPYLHASQRELIKILITAMLVALVVSALVAMWFRHSLSLVVGFTDNLAKKSRPHFYLGRELNALTTSIAQMKDTLENRAYVAEYVHTLTHELKSPLSAITASSELLIDDIAESDRRAFAMLIGEQAGRMTTLIDRLLTLARLEQPTFELDVQEVDLYTFCQDLIAQNQTKFLQKSLDVALIGHAKIQGDVFWLGQAIDNLLENATAHAISFVLVVLDERRVMVVNDCELLPDFVVHRAFERYFSMSHDKKGVGLGLPLVASVAEKHGGTVGFGQMSLDKFIKTLPAHLASQIPNTLLSHEQNLVVVQMVF